MAPLVEIEMKDICSSGLPNASVASKRSQSLANQGGILFLEVPELKEELCMEKEELDFLLQQSNEEYKTRNKIRKQNKATNSVQGEIYAEIEELQQILYELDEAIDLHTFETKTVNFHNEELKCEIEKLLREGQDQKVLTEGRQQMHISGPMARRSSRYLRHQKRRHTAPLVSAPSAA